MMNANGKSGGGKKDIVIAGGSFAGLALAIALRQGSDGGLSVTVADPGINRPGENLRATAIAAAARRLFETIGVWPEMEKVAQPMLDMVVTDSKLDNAMRPTYLTFEGEVEPGEPFAHMVENDVAIAALLDKARSEGVDLRPLSVTGFEHQPAGITVTLSDGSVLPARLLVAADGARSSIREKAGIATHGWDYDQSGIVTTVAHEREHHGRAEEHFLPAGPFAILPLTGNRSSIVWTETRKEADRIVALPDEEFHAELEKRFGLHLGEIKVIGPRRAFPLGLFVARSFIADRIALIGDAAHLIHPIAGQGLNMGLRDVAALAESIIDAVRMGIDPGAVSVLERYQRWRRFDTMAMGIATDSLNRLFSNNSDVLRAVRDVGLGIVDRLPVMKRFFIREAAGLTGDVPKLLKGEAL
jgi:2-octaprenyl-6-methoxyphenol hydroxylase